MSKRQAQPTPRRVQPGILVTQADIRRTLQAEADRAAQEIGTNEAPGGGRYKVPVIGPDGQQIGVEWRDGQGNPVPAPEGA